MPTRRSATLAMALVIVANAPAFADDDFQLTYHVEPNMAARLSIDDCADLVEREASRAGFRAGGQRFEGRLAVVSGGADKRGAFVVQCIAVDDKTVSVVQGIDYSQRKTRLGAFADEVQAALLKAAK